MNVNKPCPHCAGVVQVDTISQGGLLVEVRATCTGCGRIGSAPLAGVPASVVDATLKLSPAQLAVIAAHDAALQDLAQRQ